MRITFKIYVVKFYSQEIDCDAYNVYVKEVCGTRLFFIWG